MSSRICSSENWRLCGDERAAVGVARPDRAAEVIERVAEAVVAEMGHVEDDAEPLHLAQQLVAARAEAAARVRALRVDARPVVRRTDRAQTVLRTRARGAASVTIESAPSRLRT